MLHASPEAPAPTRKASHPAADNKASSSIDRRVADVDAHVPISVDAWSTVSSLCSSAHTHALAISKSWCLILLA